MKVAIWVHFSKKLNTNLCLKIDMYSMKDFLILIFFMITGYFVESRLVFISYHVQTFLFTQMKYTHDDYTDYNFVKASSRLSVICTKESSCHHYVNGAA